MGNSRILALAALLVAFGPLGSFAGFGSELKQMAKAFANGIESSVKTPEQKKNSIMFHLHSNTNNLEDKTYSHEIIYKKPNSLKDVPFNKNCVTKLLIHGYIQNKDYEFPQNVKTAYLTRMRKSNNATEKCWNIIVVGWGKLSGGLYFTGAVANLPLVGERVGEMLAWLVNLGYIESPKLIHLIGQSLGGHVVGYSAVSFTKLTGKKPGRISGLDPAGPGFASDKSTGYGRILKTTDADFVDVYHCNMGAYGINKAIGHLEFYPNAEPLSNIQPQCNPLVAGKRDSGEDAEMCSHNYCPKYFAWTLLHPTTFEKCESTEEFVAKKGTCSGDTVNYGEDVDITKKGSYYGKIIENLDDMALFQ